MRREAEAGDPQCEQLLLDLLRVAALYVAERMRGEVAATVAAHLQHAALAAARRAAQLAARQRPKRKLEKEAKEKVRVPLSAV